MLLVLSATGVQTKGTVRDNLTPAGPTASGVGAEGRKGTPFSLPRLRRSLETATHQGHLHPQKVPLKHNSERHADIATASPTPKPTQAATVRGPLEMLVAPENVNNSTPPDSFVEEELERVTMTGVDLLAVAV